MLKECIILHFLQIYSSKTSQKYKYVFYVWLEEHKREENWKRSKHFYNSNIIYCRQLKQLNSSSNVNIYKILCLDMFLEMAEKK